MAAPADVTVLLVSAAIGVALKAFYDELASPWLKFEGLDRVLFGGPVGSGFTGFQPPLPVGQYIGVRLRVRNREKFILNRQAENCVAWLHIDGTDEKFQLSWVPESDAVTINAGDFRYVDLCAWDVAAATIVAPTERGYFRPSPRPLGTSKRKIEGRVDVTCANGHPVSRRIRITPVGTSDIKVEFF